MEAADWGEGEGVERLRDVEEVEGVEEVEEFTSTPSTRFASSTIKTTSLTT